MKKLLVIAIFITGLFSGCHIGTSGSFMNDHIYKSLRDEMAGLNKKLFNSLIADDIGSVKALMSKGLVENLGSKTDTIVNTVAKIFKATDYKVLDEYYTRNTTTHLTNTLFSDPSINNASFAISYLALNEEMYVSLLVSKNLPANCLVLAIYGKYPEGWKLNILRIGEYDILNKTALQYYNEALNQYKKGYLINACNDMMLASELSNAGGENFKYTNFDDMKAFYSKVVTEGNATYHFPITVHQIIKQPQIFRVNPQFINEPRGKGVFPVINYLTTINLKDSIALKAQNDALQKVIAQVFKGIDQQDVILYQVTDEFNNAVSSNPSHYRHFLQKVR